MHCRRGKNKVKKKRICKQINDATRILNLCYVIHYELIVEQGTAVGALWNRRSIRYRQTIRTGH